MDALTQMYLAEVPTLAPATAQPNDCMSWRQVQEIIARQLELTQHSLRALTAGDPDNPHGPAYAHQAAQPYSPAHRLCW